MKFPVSFPHRYTIYHLSLISITLLAFQCILAWLYYDLRMHFVDAPFMVFRMIQLDSLSIQVGRYGAFITQIVPFLLQKANLSVDTILKCYSLAFSLFPLIVSLFLLRLRQYGWIILLGLYFSLFCTDAWFWPNNEIHQGVTWMVLGMGFWQSDLFQVFKKIGWIIFFVIMTTAIFCHPLMIPLMFFIIGFFIINKDLNFESRQDLIFIAGIIILSAAKWYASKHNWYDSGKLTMLSDSGLSNYMGFYKSEVFREFISQLFKSHLHVWCIIFLWISFKWDSGRWLILIWSFGCILIHLALTCVLMDKVYLFYAQSQWMILTFMLAMPLVFSVKKIVSPKVIPPLLFIFLLIWLNNFHISGAKFGQRLKLVDRVLDRMDKNNMNALAIANPPEEIQNLFIMDWGVPVESLLRSVSGGSIKTFYFQKNNEALPEQGMFRSCFEMIRIEELHPSYFKKFVPSYQSINYEEFMSVK